jgi:osmoprotectant transport system permease protein
MGILTEIIAWFADPGNWEGANGVPARAVEHLWYSAASFAIALIIAVPVGLWVGHTDRGGTVAVNLANVGRAVPSFGIIVLMFVYFGLGFAPVLVALVAFAVPPMLTNTYTGVRDVDPEVRDSAEGMGMRGGQVLLHVEVPVAMPLIMAGVRTSAIQVVATATLAAVVGLGGFGRYIINGFAVQDYPQMVGGAVLVAVLALLVEGTLAFLQRLVVSDGVAGESAEILAKARSQLRPAASTSS